MFVTRILRAERINEWSDSRSDARFKKEHSPVKWYLST